MKIKIKGVIFSFVTIMYFIAATIGASCAFYAGIKIVDNYKAKQIVTECEILDHALDMYAAAHQQINESTMTMHMKNGNKTISYEKGRTYPKTLADLGKLRVEQGYFSSQIDLTKFEYQVISHDTGMTYKLGVHMPNGYYYTSPGSEK